MCNDGLSAEACVLMSDILTNSGTCKSLKVLHFYNNMSGSGGAAAVAEIVKSCPLLEDFRFSATRSMTDGCLTLAQVNKARELHCVLIRTTISSLIL